MAKKPVIIEVRYYRNLPTVKLPPSLEGVVEVKLIDTLEEGTLFMEHEGVSIYSAITDESGDSYQECEWLDACTSGMDEESDEVFDVRDLPQVPPKKQGKYMKLFPQEPNMAHEWKRRIAFQIDEGTINDDGYFPAIDKK